MKEFLSAISFLTIIPTGKKLGNENLKGSIIFFPVVGGIIGYLAYLFCILSLKIFSVEISSFLTLIFLIFITGGIHLDGFSDTIDGLYGGRNKEEILKIMEDPHIGSFGSISLFCLIFLKFLILKNIPSVKIMASLTLSGIISRYSVCFFSHFSNPAKNYGLSEIFFQKNRVNFLVSTIFTLTFSFFFKKSYSFLILFLNIIFFLILNFNFKRKIGGLTGDILGFIIETTEILNLFLLWKL